MTNTGFIARHPLAIYFALTFALSWGGILLVAGGPGSLPGKPEDMQRLLPFAVMAMLIGPSVAGILMTGLVHGRGGFRELLSRLLKWRVGARWYLALLTAPLLMAATLLVLSLISPAFLPGIVTADQKGTILLVSLAYGLAAGLFEEVGWTGFAVPQLRRQYGVLKTGAMLGLIWGFWHFLSNFYGSGTSSGAFSPALFLPATVFAVLALPAYRTLMTWVYERTGSLLVAVLMHASFTGVWLILMPEGISGMPFFIWYFVVGAALWVVVAAVVLIDRGHLSRQPLPQPMA